MSAASPPQGGPAEGATYFLGRYRVVDEIGVGGMASVHLARMDGPGGFQKWIAIKRIHAHLVEDDSFITMFLDEARVAARISHPNVATVFELGKHEDTYWIAMEYLHGEPLRELMRRTEELGAPMPPEIACRIIADAAEGLHAAHELLGKNGEKLNLVHRDVTPHNLFVTYDGATKVVDFGIAKFSSRMASTRAGTLKGKLAYMSPEQVAGEQVDRRTDVFALGVVLWELTTGQRLFRMESDLDTLAKVQECNVPRPSTLIRGYPIDLEKIVLKALAKNRGERFRTAREFSRALQSLLMKRGLFIASDEVASYVNSIFADRIQKREAHLRWAAEVTQTVNIDTVKPGVPDLDGSLHTYNSVVQPAQQGGRAMPPRPAAGAPAAPLPPPRMTPATAAAEGLADLDSMEDDGPTIMAAAPTEDDEPEFDDGDATIVTTSASAKEPARPVPAAGRPVHDPDDVPTSVPRGNVSFAVPPRAVPAAHSGGSGPLPAVLVDHPPPPAPMQPQMQFQPSMQQTQQMPQQMQQQMQQQGQMQAQMQQQLQQQGQMQQGQQSYQGQGYPQAPMPPPPRSPDQTVLARAVKPGVPMWAVGLASGVAALVLLSVVYLLVASPHKTATPKPNGSAAGSASAIVSGNPAVGDVPLQASGPFGAARAGFTAVVSPTSSSSGSTATPPPPATATAAPTVTGSAAGGTADTAAPTATATAAPTATATAAPTATATVVATAKPTATFVRPPPTAVAGGATGQLTVISLPPCDAAYDNGAPLGQCPIYKKTLPVGSHRIKLVTNSPHVEKVIPVIIVADQVTKQTVNMTQ